MKKLLLVSLLLASIGFAEETANYKKTEEQPEQQKEVKKEIPRINFLDYMARINVKGDKELVADLSKNIRPQDDFYKFVNENWEKKTVLPPTKPSWGAFSELEEKNQNFTRNLIKELKSKKVAQLDSDEKKILTLYDSYSNMKKRNQLAYTPLKDELNKINNITNINDFQNYNIEITKDGKMELYGWGVGTDLNSSKQNAVYLSSPGLGLSREYYQKETEENTEIIEEYKKYISDLLGYIGESNTEGKAAKIVEFEKSIAKTLLKNEELNDVKNYNNPRKVSDLSKIVKNIDLAKYLEEAGINTESVIISELKYYENMDKLITDENIETIKDYIKFHLVSSSAGLLTDELGQRSFEFYGKYMNGQKEREILEKRALYFVDGSLGELIGKEYVKKHFSEEAKRETKVMVDYIMKAFRKRIQRLAWMSDETKVKALEKLDKMSVKVGYPDKWEDYSTLVINENDSLYVQMKNIAKWEYQRDLQKVGKPVDKTKWFMNAHEINAYYSPTENEIVFPAGILQFPFYDLKNSGPGVNFGGIGVVIGHEITHGFDVAGASFDGDGNVKDWWNKKDKTKFDAVTKKLSQEFSKYSVAPNVYVNGEFTLTENIADLGGVNIAYEALKMYLNDHHERDVRIDGYTQNQLFFMSFARIWHQKTTDEYLKNLVKTDSHSPSYFRVNGTLINVDGFHNIFETKPGDKLYKESKERIRIW